MQNRGLIDVAKQQALQQRLLAISHNLANLETPSFKSRLVTFKQHKNQKSGIEGLSFVEVKGIYKDFTQGNFKQTHNPLDIALIGPGFLKVNTPEGDAYTRNGQLTLNNLGQIMTTNDHLILDEGGAPITIPTQTRQIKITSRGVILADGTLVGQVSLTEFDNLLLLEEKGKSLYTSIQPGNPATSTKVMQGGIESSNVQPILELTNLIDMHRAYERLARDSDNEDERIEKAIDVIGKPPS